MKKKKIKTKNNIKMNQKKVHFYNFFITTIKYSFLSCALDINNVFSEENIFMKSEEEINEQIIKKLHVSQEKLPEEEKIIGI
jgi:hypothetical protein